MLADPDIDISAIARSAGTRRPYAAGDVIFREGDPADFVYVVLSGAVEIDHEGRTIETIGPGKALGILSVLDERPRTVTAVMRLPGEIAAVDPRRFRFMVEEVPGFVWYVMGELAHRLRATNAAL